MDGGGSRLILRQWDEIKNRDNRNIYHLVFIK